jgi:tetratricopeptide (TPR) repeat protein
VPPDAAVRPFADMLPAGLRRASYTQWELVFARHHRKRLSLYLANPDYVPDQAAPTGPDFPELQEGFVAYLKGEGLDRSYFSTTDQLCRLVLKEDWPQLRRPKPIALPYPSLGTLFKGREEFLARLRDRLARAADGHATAIAGKALHGLGGVGKTRLAVEYAWRHQSDYTALLFVAAETPQDLRRNLAALAGPLVFDLPENAAPEEEARLAAALRWLAEHPGWFLIVDNVDTPEAAEAVEELLARLHGGQVLLTGRLAQWSACVEPLELDVLAAEDAAAFLLERTQRGRRKVATDAADAAELARELDGLALALEQAGAYIAQRRLSLADYLRDWRAHVPAVQGWHDLRLMKYPRSVEVTWQTTVERLGGGEVALLRLLAWLAPEPLPLFVLEGYRAEALWREAVALQQQEGPAVAVSCSVRDALAGLSDYSMVRWDAEGETVVVHRVVQEMLRTRLPPGARVAWLTLGLRLLDAARPGDPTDVRTWPRWNPLRPHIAVVVAQADESGIAEPTALLMNRLGGLLWAKALHAEAEPLLRRALAIDERSLGPEHPNVAIRLNDLALLLKATSRLGEAEPLMRRALAIDERSLGPEHPEFAIHLNNLAGLLGDTNRLAEAEPLLRRVVDIFEKGLGEGHPNVATALNNLGQVLVDTSQLGEAELLLRRALAIHERSLGPEHPTVAINLNNLAGLLRVTNRLGEAEPLLRRALAIDERSLGPEHPDVAIALNNLAQVLEDTNRLAEAEPLSRRMARIFLDFTRRTGHQHPHLREALEIYRGRMEALGRSEADIQAELDQLKAGKP